MTRPARSSKTAGSGMPSTTAATAADSTGLTPRTSSREALASCKRQGTSAAAAMQAKAATARSGGSSPKMTSMASDSPAVSNMIAECLSRSGQGEKKNEVESSIAINPGSHPIGLLCLRAAFSALPDVHRLMLRLRDNGRLRRLRPFHPCSQDNLPKRQQDYRYDERRNIIEEAKQQHPGEQILFVHLPQAHQHGRIEHAKPAGGVAREAKQCRRDKDDGDHDKTEVWVVRHQFVHGECTKAEIDDADRDLQQRQRAARQHHRPWSATHMARLRPDPGHIADESGDDGNGDRAVEPGWKLIDGAGGFRMIGNSEPQHRRVAEPEGETR